MTPDYLAGLFDGEGCIDVMQFRNKLDREKISVCVRARIKMSNSARRLGDLIHAEYGGTFYVVKPRNPKLHTQFSVEWNGQVAAQSFLPKILPYLVLKREQALLSLWWANNFAGKGKAISHRYGEDNMKKLRSILIEELREMKQDSFRTAEAAIARMTDIVVPLSMAA